MGEKDVLGLNFGGFFFSPVFTSHSMHFLLTFYKENVMSVAKK